LTAKLGVAFDEILTRQKLRQSRRWNHAVSGRGTQLWRGDRRTAASGKKGGTH